MTQQLWPLWLLQGLLGWLLFSQAHHLVHSSVFRLGSGTAGFVMLSTLIVAFIIYRCVWTRRKLDSAAGQCIRSAGCVRGKLPKAASRQLLVLVDPIRETRCATASKCRVPWHVDTLNCSVCFCIVTTQAWTRRSVPNKKHMAAATALFGTSILGLLKYFFGTWIPSFQQLVSNKVPSAVGAFSAMNQRTMCRSATFLTEHVHAVLHGCDMHCSQRHRFCCHLHPAAVSVGMDTEHSRP